MAARMRELLSTTRTFFPCSRPAVAAMVSDGRPVHRPLTRRIFLIIIAIGTPIVGIRTAGGAS
jgi:hypothetical protein